MVGGRYIQKSTRFPSCSFEHDQGGFDASLMPIFWDSAMRVSQNVWIPFESPHKPADNRWVDGQDDGKPSLRRLPSTSMVSLDGRWSISIWPPVLHSLLALLES